MRFLPAVLILLTHALAQASDPPTLARYLLLTASQLQALTQLAADANDFVATKQVRLDELHQSIADARNSASPDPTALGQLYVEYETILRQVTARTDQWKAASAAILSPTQLALAAKLGRASELYTLASYALYSGLLGSEQQIPSSAFEQYIQPLISPSYLSGVQSYLSLTDAQVTALSQILNRFSSASGRVANQVTQANLDAQLELIKDPPDPARIGQLIAQMDATATSQSTTVAQLHDELLTQLTVEQRQALQVLVESMQLQRVAQSAVCFGLVDDSYPTLTVVAGGAVAFDVNFPPRPSLGCQYYGIVGN